MKQTFKNFVNILKFFQLPNNVNSSCFCLVRKFSEVPEQAYEFQLFLTVKLYEKGEKNKFSVISDDKSCFNPLRLENISLSHIKYLLLNDKQTSTPQDHS